MKNNKSIQLGGSLNESKTEISIKCKFCQSQNYVKQGFRKTGQRGKIQKYYCQDCQKYFTVDNGFYRMKNNSEKITKAIDLYFSNLSSRKVRNHFKRHEDTKVSHNSVLDWCRRYALKVHKYTDKLKPKLSGKIYADETEIKRKKNNDIFWCSVDWDTRFINATLYSPRSQNFNDALVFMKKIKKNIRPSFIQTDALVFYPKAFRKSFYSRFKKDRVEHRINNVSQTGKHNVRIETVFSKIKDRVYDFRGLKALWSAPLLMAGLVIQHNFIEEHTTTQRLPCELAGLNFVNGVNRWLELIKMSSVVP